MKVQWQEWRSIAWVDCTSEELDVDSAKELTGFLHRQWAIPTRAVRLCESSES